MPVSRRVRWLAVAVVAVAIAAVSVTRPPPGTISPSGPLGVVGRDKWLHALGYATLGGTLSWALDGTDSRAVALALGGAFGWGLAIELVQFGLPYRAFSVLDMAANGVGAVIGVGVVWVVTR